jgi:hypothetical protein
MAANRVTAGMRRERKANFNEKRRVLTNLQHLMIYSRGKFKPGADGLVSKRRRSWKGPTTFRPRCIVKTCNTIVNKDMAPCQLHKI